MTDLGLEHLGLSTKPQLDWIDELIALKRSTSLSDFFHTHSKGLMLPEGFALLPATFSRASQQTLGSSSVDTLSSLLRVRMGLCHLLYLTSFSLDIKCLL